ncbi:thioredoxin [Candidatus Woesearchaeota archaeon]|jgi:thioredoxin 1|nr:thioredoxin [Candidatus Woesearchaeota archaeon]MBT4322186.1 thioredoxin [Candidatus Woesearchaeota archaeon]MBT4631206.1 thioredoxin [Candidatus Woesearchaeota archaeon]
MVEKLTKESFREKIFDYSQSEEWKYLGDKPAIIDFYADWCGPCKMISPIIDELAKDYEGKVDIYKIDTQAEPELSGSFGVMSIPSLLFIPSKGKPTMITGGRSKAELEKLIKEFLFGEK